MLFRIIGTDVNDTTKKVSCPFVDQRIGSRKRAGIAGPLCDSLK
jgi:hypothetical protein